MSALSEEVQENCPICTEKHTEVTFSCSHGICSDCILPWTKQIFSVSQIKIECPICRRPIRQYEYPKILTECQLAQAANCLLSQFQREEKKVMWCPFKCGQPLALSDSTSHLRCDRCCREVCLLCKTEQPFQHICARSTKDQLTFSYPVRREPVVRNVEPSFNFYGPRVNLSAFEDMLMSSDLYQLFNLPLQQPPPVLQRGRPLSTDQIREIEAKRNLEDQQREQREIRHRELRERQQREQQERELRDRERQERLERELQDIADSAERKINLIRQRRQEILTRERPERKQKNVQPSEYKEEINQILKNIQDSGGRVPARMRVTVPVGSPLERFILSLPQEKRVECQGLYSYTIPILKELCRNRGLKLSGNKLDLISRIMNHPIPAAPVGLTAPAGPAAPENQNT